MLLLNLQGDENVSTKPNVKISITNDIAAKILRKSVAVGDTLISKIPLMNS